MSSNIPRNLICVWGYKHKSLPKRMKKRREQLLQSCPDWNHILIWPDDALEIANSLPEHLSVAVVSILRSTCSLWPWVCKADITRFIALWYFGGIYIDLCDVDIVGNLQDLLVSSFVITEGMGHSCELDILGARKGDARLLQVLERQVANLQSVKGQSPYPATQVLRMTGPGMLTSIAVELKLTSLPLASRYLKVQNESGKWKQVLKVSTVYFEVRHAGSWLPSPGLKLKDFPSLKSRSAVRTKFVSWNKCALQKATSTSNVAAISSTSVPLASMLNLATKHNSSAQQLLDMLLQDSANFPIGDFGRIGSVKELPAIDNRNKEKRGVMLSIIVTPIPTNRKQLLFSKLKVPWNGTLHRELLTLLAKSGGRLTQALKQWARRSGQGLHSV